MVLATNATRSNEVAPVAMYTRTDERGLTSVVVQSAVESGPYELWARWRDRHRQERQRRLTTAFTVPPGQSVVRPLPEWNTVHRVRTELRAPGTDHPVRTVILAPRERSDARPLDRGPR